MQRICAWCGVTVSVHKAIPGTHGGVKVFLHQACSNTIGVLNRIDKRLTEVENKLGLGKTPVAPPDAVTNVGAG